MAIVERVVVGSGEELMKLQLYCDKLQMASWVHDLAPWEVISHLTFRWEVSLDAARRGYERFMRRCLPHLSYFYAEEANPSRDGYHVHALWADCKTMYRREAWAAWFKRFGRARIEPVRSEHDVADYCSKYVTKEGAWWNVNLQWHRLQALQGRGYELERESDQRRDTRLPVPQKEFGFAPEVFNLAADPPPPDLADPAPTPAPADPRQSTFWEQGPDGLFHCQQR